MAIEHPVRSDEGRLNEASRLSTAGLVAGVLGATAAAFGVVIYFIDPAALSLTLINFGIALVGLVFYAATNLASIRRIASGRSTPLVLLEVVLILGVIATLVGINFAASRSKVQWDLTTDQLFTLRPQSQAVAAKLDKDVEIVGFYKPADSRRGRLQQLVSLYERHSSRISTRFINPDTAPPRVIEQYQMTSTSPRIVVYVAADRQTKIQNATEEELTNALISIVEREPVRVRFLSGHGEPSIDDVETDQGYKRASQDLRDEGYTVETITMADKERVPQNTGVLVIAGSRAKLFKHELDGLKEYLLRGGRALIMLEPGLDPGLSEVLRSFGIQAGDDLVVDPNPAARAMGFGADAPVVTQFEQHPITAPLAGSALLFYWVRSLSPIVGLANVETTTLIQTSPNSWGERDFQAEGEAEQDEDDVPGPVPIAIASVRRTVLNPKKLNDQARLVVIGDGSFASNRFILTSGNSDLLLNAVGWLSGEEDRVTIRPKRRGTSRIPLTDSQHYGLVFFSVNLMPLLIVGIGFSVWALRRRK